MADAALPALLSLASHELRGPTGVIRGYLKLLQQDTTLGERSRQLAGEATRCTGRLCEILDDMSELARLQDDALRPAMRSMSLRAILQKAVAAVTLPKGCDAEIQVVAPVDVRKRVDEQLLRPALETLIFALVRGLPELHPIELRLAKGRAATNIVIVMRTVAPGPVSDRAPDRTRGATGLRLPIAEAVIKAHGGRLQERWVGGRWVGFVVKLI